ncbi:MAG: RIP metalloprotease RseP [Opitutales bacterium]
MAFLSSLFGDLWSIFLVLLFFGGSIFVHELGHFLAARRRGAKVERFSIGFGPAIWSWRGRDGVEYRLAWFPLGGYVMLPQLADLGPLEGAAAAEADQLPPVSYATKMIVFAAGAFFNILFAFALATILWAAGQPVAVEDLTARIGIARPQIEIDGVKTAPGPAYVAGLRTGDLIVAVDGKSVQSFSDIAQLIALGGGRDAQNRPEVAITYERAGQRLTTTVHPELIGPEKIRDIGVEPAVKLTIESVQAGSPAEQAGLQVKDVIVAIDGQPAEYSAFVTEYLRQKAGQPAVFSILRGNAKLAVTITPRQVTDPATKTAVYRIGVSYRGALTLRIIHTPPWTQIYQQTVSTWRNLLSVINPHSDIGLSKMSGPVGIGRIFWDASAAGGIRYVLWIAILVNVNLAIFNLLPVPVLDGGQMAFATFGKLRGRALSPGFIATSQSIFAILIFSMLIYVTIFGDLRRWIRDAKADAQAKEAAAEVAKPAAPAKP